MRPTTTYQQLLEHIDTLASATQALKAALKAFSETVEVTVEKMDHDAPTDDEAEEQPVIAAPVDHPGASVDAPAREVRYAGHLYKDEECQEECYAHLSTATDADMAATNSMETVFSATAPSALARLPLLPGNMQKVRRVARAIQTGELSRRIAAQQLDQEYGATSVAFAGQQPENHEELGARVAASTGAEVRTTRNNPGHSRPTMDPLPALPERMLRVRRVAEAIKNGDLSRFLASQQDDKDE